MTVFDQMVNVGIDLGTTNSVVSVFSNGQAEEVKVGNSAVVPSAIYVDKKGGVNIGFRAYQNLNHSQRAAAVQTEFKRRMGERVKIDFKGTGVSMSPEELSAQVLKELADHVEQRFGESPPAAVITVPAMFELPQRDATVRAGELAGFSQTILLQEPVAAAAAYGLDVDAHGQYWVVFDYGGGTFDASMISVRDGSLTVVKNAGDNYLGGADLDRIIVNECILPSLGQKYDLGALLSNPADPEQVGRTNKLKYIAEQIKKELSTDNSVQIFEEDVFPDDSGSPVDVEIEVTRERLEGLISTQVCRAVDITKQLIEDCGLTRNDVSKILMVGGTTFIPYVREQVKSLGIDIDISQDPMTVVSRGASVFASTKRLSKDITESKSVEQGTARVVLEFDAVAADTETEVMGRISLDGPGTFDGASLQIVRSDGEWQSSRIAVREDGKFLSSLMLRPKGYSEFELVLRDASGSRIACHPAQFGITFGTTIAKATMPSGLQIGLADGTAAMLIPAGATLPAISDTQRRKTTSAVRSGSDDVLRVPILSGDEVDIESNLTGTYLELTGAEIDRNLPEGSEVEITAECDESGHSSITFTFPLIDYAKEVDNDATLEHEPPEVMRAKLRDCRDQLNACKAKASDLGDSTLIHEIDSFMSSTAFTEVEISIGQLASGDSVAAGQARNRLADIRKKTLYFEGLVEWPTRLAEFEEIRSEADGLVNKRGDASEKARWEVIKSEASRAIEAKDPRMLERSKDSASGMLRQMVTKDPEFWKGMLAHLYQEKDTMRDQSRAASLFSEGMIAVQSGDTDRVRGVCQQLIDLLPPQVAASVQGRGGGGLI